MSVCAVPSTHPTEVRSTLSRHLLVDGFRVVVDLERSQGSRILDSSTGRWYLDFYTFFASAPLGINHPGLTGPEVTERLVRAARNKPSNSDAYTVEMADFVAAMERHAMPQSLPYLFLVEGGAVAVENAVKTAFDWKARHNALRSRSPRGDLTILHFRQAFHGRTGYTLSLTNTDPVKTDLFPKFDWPRIDNPAALFPLEGENLARTEAAEVAALQQAGEAFRRAPHRIAAVIIEPIQGEGGDNHFRGEFLRELRQLCDDNDALLILDEIQTGVGLTGRMWAHEHFGFEPDILCFGKKLQVCGIMASRRLDEVPDHVFRLSGRINSTWGGNLTDMVRATRYLQIIAEENLIEHARRQGARLLEQLQLLSARFSGMVAQVRGRGLMCAFDLPTPELRSRVIDRCHENGLLILPSGPRGVRFRPALNITNEDLEEGMHRVSVSLDEALA